MHHDVHHAAGHLIGGKGDGEGGIENGKPGAVQVGAEPALFVGLFIGQNGGVAALAAGGRNGEDDAHGQGAGQRDLPQPELPHVGVGIGCSVGDCLGGVDDTAAPKGQNEVGAEGEGLLYSLTGQGETGIRLYAGQELNGQSGLLQTFFHPAQQSAGGGAFSAADQQNPGAAQRTDLRSGLKLGVRTKQNAGGGIKLK